MRERYEPHLRHSGIHGRDDLLGRALTKIAAYGGEAGIIVAIGDYVDRARTAGRSLTGCCRALPIGWRLIALKGQP